VEVILLVKKFQFHSIVIVLVFTVILLFSCAPVRDSDSPEGIYALASEALEDGNAALALELFNRGLDEYPEHPTSFDYLLGRAEALLMLGRFEESIVSANEAFSSAPDSRSANEALLLIAQIESNSGRYASCFETLHMIDEENIEPEDAEIAVSLLRNVLEKLNLHDLQVAESGDDWTRVYVLLELFNRYMAQGDLEKVLLIAAEVRTQYPDAYDRYDISDIENSIEHPIIALVLPLSAEDDAARYAESILMGVELAIQRSSGLYRNPPELIIYDFGDDPDSLRRIITSLGRNPACLAVIGPLTSRNIMEVADIALEYGLPIISPSASEYSDEDSFVHRLYLNNAQGIPSVAEYAVRSAGCMRLAIIHEYTAESIANADIFAEVAESLGAIIVAREGYEIGSTDYKSQIQAIKYCNPDGIFLPISANDAIQLVPQLLFYSMETPVFGSSRWDDELLLNHGGEYIKGAVFPVSSNISSSMNPETEAFLWYYERMYDSIPDKLAARGYDTARIILAGFEVAVLNRSSMEIFLAGFRPRLGASGFCSLGNSASYLGFTPLVKVIDGDVVTIE